MRRRDKIAKHSDMSSHHDLSSLRRQGSHGHGGIPASAGMTCYKAFFISTFLHIGLIFLLISLTGGEPARPAGEMAYIVSIDMIKGGEPAGGEEFVAEGTLKNPEQVTGKKSTVTSRFDTKTPKKISGGDGSGKGEASGSGTGASSGGDSASTSGTGGGSIVLAKIRAKIEAAKSYPASARKMGIEGRPTVVFEISESGAIKSVKIAESSGKPIIDTAAIETVKKASPLPYYPGPITLAIRYDLD